ncbi:hypothetical protein AnaeK_3242 [Anaeromyxobacter sp. K]|uniref:hypothetical protein n=1 Tax=Anaeromyxobacter sp. (strain K) TaxID=447217 RepID=UPI00015F9DA6|nr:hypothetical protein [Anaeromyxobacter sp. K]ACG74462.1 hypothetical protein AnaeK_3242 [Anaeromyxobacter sp. K]
MTARSPLPRPALACLAGAWLLAGPACAASRTAAAVAPAGHPARPRVELLAPCAAADRDGVPCTHRHAVLEVSY